MPTPCVYTYKGKDYSEEEFKDVLASAPTSEIGKYIEGFHSSTPDMPMKSSWHEMALRRILKHAVDQNYHGLSWTPGEDQAARYDLSKQISRIEYEKVPTFHKDRQDTWVVNAFDLDGNGVLKQAATSEELPDIVGKEVAEKIVNSKDNTGELSGLDLKVGGEGMRGFYDDIVPKYLNKFGKKYGSKVGTVEIGDKPSSEDIKISDQHTKLLEANEKAYADWQKAKEDTLADKPITEAERHNLIRQEILANGRWKQSGNDLRDFSVQHHEALDRVTKFDQEGQKTVPYLPITPEMRKSVGEEGVPLFNKEKNYEAKDDDVPTASGYRSIADTGSLGMVDLTPNDYALISTMTGGGERSNARNLHNRDAYDLVGKLLKAANNLPNGAEKNRVYGIADHILTAANDNGVAGVPIFKIDPNRTPAEQRELEMHEGIVHGGQRAVAGNGNALELFPKSVTDQIAKNILARKAWKTIQDHGYPSNDKPLMALESEAWGLSGKFNRLGALTDDEVDELMWEHLQAQTSHHGDKLNTVDPTGQKYVQALREAAKRYDDRERNKVFYESERSGLGEGSGQEEEVPSPSGTPEGGGTEGNQSDSGTGSEGVGGGGEGGSDSDDLEDRELFNRETPSATGQTATLEPTTESEGGRGQSPEPAAGVGGNPVPATENGTEESAAIPESEAAQEQKVVDPVVDNSDRHPLIHVDRSNAPAEVKAWDADEAAKWLGKPSTLEILSRQEESLDPKKLKTTQTWAGNQKVQQFEKLPAETAPPISVVRTPEGDFVVDGVHRASRAAKDGLNVRAVVHTVKLPSPKASMPVLSTTTVSVPLQTASSTMPILTVKVLPLSVVKSMATGLNPNSDRQPRSVREVMKLAQERFSNKIVP